MYLITFLYSLVANFAHPVTPTFIQNLQLHSYMFGVAFACMSTTNFLFSPFWGKLAKNVSYTTIYATCFIGYGIGQAIFGLATTEFMIAFGRLFAGFFIGGITVIQILYIMEYSEEGKSGSNLAFNVTLNVVTGAFGYMIGGLLGDISIPLTFAAQVVGLISLGVLTWLILGDTREKETMDTKELLRESNPFKAILDAKSIITLSIVLFLTVSVCTSFASTCYDQCFNYFIKDQFGFKPSYNGLLKAAVGMITLVANGTICTFLMKNTDIRKSIIGVLGMCAGMLVLVTITNQVIPFIIINLIMFGFNAIYQPMLQSTISLLKVRDKGTLVGIFNSMRSLGNVGGSLFAGFIYDTGPRLSFVFSATAFFIAMMAAVIFAKRECHQ